MKSAQSFVFALAHNLAHLLSVVLLMGLTVNPQSYQQAADLRFLCSGSKLGPKLEVLRPEQIFNHLQYRLLHDLFKADRLEGPFVFGPVRVNQHRFAAV